MDYCVSTYLYPDEETAKGNQGVRFVYLLPEPKTEIEE